jgi:membrane protein implicated in regulation of membrane protease activity
MAVHDQNLAFLLVLIGAGLMVAEAVAPGAHLIVLGVALFVAGLIGMYGSAYGLSDPYAMAALVLGTGAVALYVYRTYDFYGGRGAGRTSDANSLTGEVGEVTERVTDSAGEVKLRHGGLNPFFEARTDGDPIPAGTRVVVTDPGGGNVVTVERGVEREE